MPLDPSNHQHYWLIAGDRIVNKYKHDQVLDVRGFSKMKYAGITMEKFCGSETQQWKFDYVEKK